MNLYKLKRELISFIYPNRCPFCDNVIGSNLYFCPTCADTLDEYQGNADFAVYCYYNDKSKPFIFEAKENGNGYAISAAASLFYEKLQKTYILESCDYIIPVPPSKYALKKRGYYFPAMLAKELSILLGIKYSDKFLKRVKESREQKTLTAAERLANISGAFSIGEKSPENYSFLLIDDVSTTGATVNEVKRVLLEAGANSVDIAVFSKGIDII